MPLLLPSFFVYHTERLSLPLCVFGPLCPTDSYPPAYPSGPRGDDLLIEAEEPGLLLGMQNAPGCLCSGSLRPPFSFGSRYSPFGGRACSFATRLGRDVQCSPRSGSGRRQTTEEFIWAARLSQSLLPGTPPPPPACHQLCPLFFWSSSPLSLTPPFPSLCSCC